MRRRCWARSAAVAALAVGALILIVLISQRHGAQPLPQQDAADVELALSSAAPQGSWGDPEEGARWEQGRRKIGVQLSARNERGPVRIALRVRPGAARWKERELEVELRNTSDKPVALRIHQTLLDTVTFVFRDPEGNVVSSFCYVTVHSTVYPAPPIILGPGKSKTDDIFLSVACDHGFQTLRPGLYSLEAVFHENSFFDPLGPDGSMLARSNRVPVRVGDP
jgi:hypothetical protein